MRSGRKTALGLGLTAMLGAANLSGCVGNSTREPGTRRINEWAALGFAGSAVGYNSGDLDLVSASENFKYLGALEQHRIERERAGSEGNSDRFYEGEMTDGSHYSGGILNRKVHGTGKIVWPSGETYTGEFRNGLFEGNGIYTFSDGRKFSGKWRKSKREGNGTTIFPNGDKFIGEWKNNKKDGIFTYISADKEKGFVIVGRYKNDNRHGGFKLTDNFGSNYVSEYVNGEFINRKGTQVIKNGERNIGEWFGGGIGKGKIIYPDGRQYVGEWKDPNPKDEDGRDFPHGEGRMTWPDGREYIGGWKLAEMHGFGTLTLEDGTKKEGFFRNGEFIGKSIEEQEDYPKDAQSDIDSKELIPRKK